MTKSGTSEKKSFPSKRSEEKFNELATLIGRHLERHFYRDNESDFLRSELYFLGFRYYSSSKLIHKNPATLFPKILREALYILRQENFLDIERHRAEIEHSRRRTHWDKSRFLLNILEGATNVRHHSTKHGKAKDRPK